LINNISAQQL